MSQGKKRKRHASDEERAPVTVRKGVGKLVKFDDDGDAQTQQIEKEKPSTVEELHSTENKTGDKASKSTKDAQRSQSQRPGGPQKPTNGTTRHPKQDERVPQHMIRKRDALRPIRKSLPIWPQADKIRASLQRNNVLVLTGETGSGKSTQVPQFLANESWCTKCIAITQPRRVAAISLARRVAEEMGTFMGSQSPTAKVGYSVRFDNATGPGTKIKFLTEGMLLQEMLRDPTMAQYSAVVVDEVHERSVNVDLILGFLKKLITDMESAGAKRKEPLKVVIMSATADVESLVNFFVGGRSPSPITVDSKDERQISKCFVEGRQYPVKTVYLPEPAQDWVEAALKIIFQIHYKEPLPGDVLVFLTGQDTIEALEKLVNDYAGGMDKDVPKVSQLKKTMNLSLIRLAASCITPLCRASSARAAANFPARAPSHP